MPRPLSGRPVRRLVLAVVVAAAALLAGCGSHFVLLHPAGPVAQKELHVVEIAAVSMAVIIAFVITLFVITLTRFRDTPGNRSPYVPEWSGNRALEIVWFVIPMIIVAIIAVPTVRTTFALNRLPPQKDPLVIDVTSLNWKWLFEYPSEHIATVDYFKVPVGQPLLFELTADGPMNTFWIPSLGGMEYTMPGRLLPLWLQVNKPGLYYGRSGNFSGVGFVDMAFRVEAVSARDYASWAAQVRRTSPVMSLADYRALLKSSVVSAQTYSRYPNDTFPSTTHGFTLEGGMYQPSGM